MKERIYNDKVFGAELSNFDLIALLGNKIEKFFPDCDHLHVVVEEEGSPQHFHKKEEGFFTPSCNALGSLTLGSEGFVLTPNIKRNIVSFDELVELNVFSVSFDNSHS